MCLIIVKPAEASVTRAILHNGHIENPDGLGFMYVRAGTLQIEKGFCSFRPFYTALRKAQKTAPGSPFIIHFRFATSGLRTAEAAHPFFVNPTLGFCHNGIITGKGNLKQSDTQAFNEHVLQKLPPNFLEVPAIVYLLEAHAAQEHSKFVFLSASGNYRIINEPAGHWDNSGCWLSSPITPPPKRDFFDAKLDLLNTGWGECTTCGDYFPDYELDKTGICELCQKDRLLADWATH